jgi:hypothetical protein
MVLLDPFAESSLGGGIVGHSTAGAKVPQPPEVATPETFSSVLEQHAVPSTPYHSFSKRQQGQSSQQRQEPLPMQTLDLSSLPPPDSHRTPAMSKVIQSPRKPPREGTALRHSGGLTLTGSKPPTASEWAASGAISPPQARRPQQKEGHHRPGHLLPASSPDEPHTRSKHMQDDDEEGLTPPDVAPWAEGITPLPLVSIAHDQENHVDIPVGGADWGPASSSVRAPPPPNTPQARTSVSCMSRGAGSASRSSVSRGTTATGGGSLMLGETRSIASARAEPGTRGSWFLERGRESPRVSPAASTLRASEAIRVERRRAVRQPQAGKRTEQLQQLLVKLRQRWLEQWEHEQRMRTEPWRIHRHPKHASSLSSPFGYHAEEEAMALASQGAPVTLRGDPVWLPGAAPGIAALGAEMGAPSRPREDAGRWPASPVRPRRSLLGTPSNATDVVEAARETMLEKLPAGAASTLVEVGAPPAAPAGQFARANAQFLGAEVLRALTPRVNVRPVSTPMRSQTPDPFSYEFTQSNTAGSIPHALKESTEHLDTFVGGGVLYPPLVGQAPVFDPRLSGPIAGQKHGSRSPLLQRGTSQGHSRKATPGTPRVQSKAHTVEFVRKLLDD